MAGPLCHYECMKIVERELVNRSIRISVFSKSDIANVISAVEPDIRRQHAWWRPWDRTGNLFGELLKLHNMLIDIKTTDSTRNQCIRYVAHYLLDSHWLGHWNYSIEKLYEPAAELLIGKDSGRFASIEPESFDEFRQAVEASISGIYNLYYQLATRSPWRFIVFNYPKFRDSVRLSVQLAAEATVNLVLMAERRRNQ